MSKTLTVYLAADLKNFNSGINEAERKLGGFGGTLNSMVGPALIAAAAAAGAFALKLGVDGVQAAVEDEASMAKLAQTLDNLNMSHDTDAVEQYIDTLEQAYGVADTQLRPAYASLARATGDVETANQALALALDISAGSGKGLDQVITALSRAYLGNTAGLSRLNAGIDAATLKSGDMEAITAKLSTLFGGAATTQASTYEGQLARLKTAGENLTEAFGKGVLGALGDTDQKTGELTDTMAELEPVLQSLGEEFGNTVGYISDVIGPVITLTQVLNDNRDATGAVGVTLNALGDTVGNFLNVWEPLAGVVTAVTGATNDNEFAFSQLETTLTAVGGGTLGLKGSLIDLTPVLDANKKSALETAGSYVTLYEKIAAADRAARDFAGTSGTVSSAIAAGIRGTQVNPEFRAPQASPNPRELERAVGVSVTEQAVASAIANIVLKNDARQGVAPRVPTTGMGVVFR